MTTTKSIDIFDANRREIGMLDLQIEHSARMVEMMRLDTAELRSLGGLQDLFHYAAFAAFMVKQQNNELSPRATAVAENLRVGFSLLLRDLQAELAKKRMTS